jgi:O-antigen/teichoic acid export membrane protein
MPANNEWLRPGVYALMEKVAGMSFNLGTAMLLLRLLEKEAFAAWGIFILLAYFVEMGRSGLLQNALIRTLAVVKLEKSAESAIPPLLTAAFVLNVGYSLLSNLLIWLSADWLCAQYQVPDLAEMLPIYYLTNLAMSLGSHSYFVQQAHMEFRGVFWMAVFYRGVPFAAVLVFWLNGSVPPLWAFSAAMLAGTLSAAAVTGWFARPYLRWSARLDRDWAVRLASYGKFVLGTNLSTMFYKNIDKLTLGQILGPAAFALYDAAGRVAQLVEAPAFSIAAVVFPKSAEKMALEGKNGVRELYERSVGATLAVILPFVALVLIFAEPVLWAFAGPKYTGAANLLRLTALFGLFMPYAVQFGTVLDSTGKPAVNFAFTLFTALLNLGLSAWLVSVFGLYGAAYATLSGYALSFVLMQFYLHKHFGINALRAWRHLPWFYGMRWRTEPKI